MNLQNYNIRTESTRRSSLFAVTVPYAKISKQEAFDLCKDLCDKLVISKEKHLKQNTFHHHLYLRTKSKYHLRDISRLIADIYEIENPIINNDEQIYSEGCIYIGTVRRETKYIKYVTKEDHNPAYKNVHIHDFSFQLKAREWAKNTEKFKIQDSFVLENASRIKVLQRLHAEVKTDELIDQANPLSKFERGNYFSAQYAPCFYHQWTNKVIEWINDWIERGRRSKDAQLYLWGKPNRGKTRFIRHLLTNCFQNENYDHQIFSPTPYDKNFAWQGYNEEIHKIMVIDEFEFDQFSMASFKQVLSGESVIINKKGEPAVYKKIDLPVIIMSNYPPPRGDLSDKFMGVVERLQVVEADMDIY